MIDQLLFVLHDPTDRSDDNFGKVVRRVSCRIVRPFGEVYSDHSRPVQESVDDVIFSMCVEPVGDDRFSGPFKGIFHICARCGANMREDAQMAHPPWQDPCPPSSGEMMLPGKIRRFLGRMEPSFHSNHVSEG